MHKLAASVAVRGRVAYASQHRKQPASRRGAGGCRDGGVAAWIMNASVRDNILFGHRYDEAFYTSTPGLPLRGCGVC